MPVLGLLFLRYAFSSFKRVEAEILKDRPMRNGRQLPVEASDFKAKSAIFLPPQARYDFLLKLPENVACEGIVGYGYTPVNTLGEAVDNAMFLIETECEQLKGVLPKTYHIFADTLPGTPAGRLGRFLEIGDVWWQIFRLECFF